MLLPKPTRIPEPDGACPLNNPETQRPRRFYGRRAGHKLHPNQAVLVETLLPELRIDPASPVDDLASLFPGSINEFWLEIGFGAGEHLIWQARKNPKVGFLASEPYINGVAKVLSAIHKEGFVNIRPYDDDVHDLLDWFPDQSLNKVFILFPDPWPKKRHNKRRIISNLLISHLARIMKPGAELRFASDIPDYVDWGMRKILENPDFYWTANHPDDWRQRPIDWPETRYERKATEAGRTASYLSFLRR